MEEVNTININNEYIPDTNNNEGMKETIKKIIEEGKKVKVYGNEFDFSRYNDEHIVKINGKEVKLVFFIDNDTYHFIINDNTNVNLLFNDKEIEANEFNLNLDLSIDRINLKKGKGLRYTPYVKNNYSYDYNNSLTKITNITPKTEYYINDYQNDSKVLTDTQKELFKEIDERYTCEHKEFNKYDIIFEGNKTYFLTEKDQKHIIRYIEKKENGEFEEKEYPLSYLEDLKGARILNLIRIDNVNTEIEHKNIIYLYCQQGNNNIIFAYDLANKKTITQMKNINLKKFSRLSSSKLSANITNDNFDKMLKKYFDKCVQEQKQKDNNEKEKNSKNNNAKYSTKTKSKENHI